MSNPTFEFLHSKQYVLEGVSGRFVHEVYTVPVYPYASRQTVEKLEHHPDAEGRESEAYRKVRCELADDWVSDITDNVYLYCQIARELGYEETP